MRNASETVIFDRLIWSSDHLFLYHIKKTVWSWDRLLGISSSDRPDDRFWAVSHDTLYPGNRQRQHVDTGLQWLCDNCITVREIGKYMLITSSMTMRNASETVIFNMLIWSWDHLSLYYIKKTVWSWDRLRETSSSDSHDDRFWAVSHGWCPVVQAYNFICIQYLSTDYNNPDTGYIYNL
jgi:hypothetical protein